MSADQSLRADCACADWKVNFPLVNAATLLQAVRTGGVGYTGKYFTYCPWCASLLRPEQITESSTVAEELRIDLMVFGTAISRRKADGSIERVDPRDVSFAVGKAK